MQSLGEVPEESVQVVGRFAGSSMFQCRYLGEVPEGGGQTFEVRFWKVPVQSLGEALRRLWCNDCRELVRHDLL